MTKMTGRDSRISRHKWKVENVKNYRYTYVISEIGVNHNGDFETAKSLVQESYSAGADAVKFQLRNLDDIYTKKILDDPNSAEWNFEYIVPILKDTQLTVEELSELRDITYELDMDFIVTPFDVHSAKICADKLKVDAFKIGSMDMINKELILKCSNYDLPVIISTGMWSESEIKWSVKGFDSLGMDYFLLLANSTYPTPYEAINLGFLHKLKDMHSLVGYSGHERGTFIPVAAAAMGATVIEKHITFDRNQEGPDHKASMEPDEFRDMVLHLRNLEKAMGGEKVVNNAEKLAKQTFARAAYAKQDIKEGHTLSMDDLTFKAPGKGILRHQIGDYIGKEITFPVRKNTYVTENNFREVIPIKDWDVPKFKNDWGVKCRFHDYDEYVQCNPKVIEFHMSQKDLDVDFYRENKDVQLIAHAPEIFDRKLVNLCSTDKDIVDQSIDILQRSIDKTLEIAKGFKGRPKLVAHLGGMTLDSTSNPTKEMMERAVENFKRLNFNSDDIEFMPENLPPRPWYFGGQWFQYGFMRAEDMLNFCDHFGLTMTLDVCHAALHCNHDKISLDNYISKVLRIASHLHISDGIGIDGEGVQIGEGEMNFESMMNVIKDKKDGFTWVTEVWSGHVNHGSGCRLSLEILEKFNNII